MPKTLSYKNLPISYRVIIDGTEITEFVARIDNLNESLDVNTVSEFTISDATITVNDVDARFVNAFNRNDSVEIKGGFENSNGTLTEETIFQGNILSVEGDVKSKSFKIRVGDVGSELHDKDIVDFGLTKYGSLEEAEDKTRKGITGSYPFRQILSPVSDESVSGTGDVPGRTDEPLVFKDELDREGDLNPLNFTYSETELLTEGGPLESNPTIQAKAPYRHITVKKAITEILDHYNITNRNIQLEDVELDEPIFSTNGRIGYETEGSALGNTGVLRWQGYVTDYIYNSANQTFYFLYSSRFSNPQIISYNISTGDYDVVYYHPTRAEFWKVLVSGNELIILGTEYVPVSNQNDPTRGWRNDHYDVSEQGGHVKVWKYNLNTDNLTVFLDDSAMFPPQLAGLLQLGSDDDLEIGDRPRVPDTNKNFVIQGSNLFYRYTQHNPLVSGVAKIPVAGGSDGESLFAVQSDRRFNHTSIDFWIEGNTGYGYANWVASTESEFKMFSFTA